VLIVGLLSLSPLRNRSFSSRKAILMSRSGVLHAVKQGKPREVAREVAIAAVVVADVRCILLFALNVAKTPRCHLNHAPVKQSIVAIATVKSDGNSSFS
jgi:hypothetical protein